MLEELNPLAQVPHLQYGGTTITEGSEGKHNNKTNKTNNNKQACDQFLIKNKTEAKQNPKYTNRKPQHTQVPSQKNL